MTVSFNLVNSFSICSQLEWFIENGYEEIKSTYDEAPEEDKKIVRDSFNEVADGLGEAFAEGWDAFEGASTKILDHERFIEVLYELGFDMHFMDNYEEPNQNSNEEG